MKKIIFIVFSLVLLCNSAVLLAQTAPEEIKSDSEKFQEYFFESLLQKGIENHDKAITALEKCLEIKPYDATVYFELGKNQKELKDYKNALTSFLNATEIDPKNKWFWIEIYDLDCQTRDYTHAMFAVNKLIEFDVIYKEELVSLYMITQQFDKALALINEMNATIGKSERRESFKMQILSQGKFQNAEITNLLEQISKNPKEESNYINLIRLYSENNNNEKAVEITKKLEAEIPTSVWAQVGLFKYYLDNNDGSKAIQSMNMVLESPKIDSKIKHRILNEFLIFVNKNPQYATDLDKAIGYFSDDKNVDVAKEIGKYYHQKKDWIKAVKYYEMDLKNKPDEDMETNLLLFQAYVETKQFDLLALKASEKIEIFPTQPQFYYFSGLANNQLGQFKKAKDTLETGLDYIVNDLTLEINFNIQLGEAYSGLGDVKKKELYFSKADQLLKNKK